MTTAVDLSEVDAEVVAAARAYGAIIDQQGDGLWAVLDQPEGSVLWLAVFRTVAMASRAYCVAHGYPQRLDARVLPRFPEPSTHGYCARHWGEAVWWTMVEPGTHEATDSGRTLRVVYDGRNVMAWDGLVDGVTVCRGQARMVCEQVVVEHARGCGDRIRALTDRKVEGLCVEYWPET